MKNIYILLLLSTFSSNLFCQQDGVIVLDSLYSYHWDEIVNDWAATDRKMYSYDAHGNKLEDILYDWSSGTNDWVFKSKTVYYWSKLNTSVTNSIIDLNYNVYPNPFTDYTTIEFPDAVQTRKIELIDIHGNTVRSLHNINSNSVRIQRENLPSGIYFIRIQSDDIYVKKVIIR